jgi:hypothetical protein
VKLQSRKEGRPALDIREFDTETVPDKEPTIPDNEHEDPDNELGTSLMGKIYCSTESKW